MNDLSIEVYISEREKILFTYLYDDGWTYTFSVMIRVGSFQGEVEFNLQKSTIEEYVVMCEKVSADSLGSVLIRDEVTDYYISFVLNPKSKVNVNGKIGGYYDKNTFTFEFKTDPSIIGSMRAALQNLI